MAKEAVDLAGSQKVNVFCFQEAWSKYSKIQIGIMGSSQNFIIQKNKYAMEFKLVLFK